MDDFLSQQRIYDILQQKAAMGGLFPLDYDSLGGVLLGGARRKRRPSAFAKRVGAYARKHGVSAAVAARALSRGSKATPSRRRKTIRGRGGASPMENFKIMKQINDLKDKLADLEADQKTNYCDGLAPPTSVAEAKRRARQCGTLPSIKRKLEQEERLYNILHGNYDLKKKE